jgi:ketosteroid isomerase-like protein
MPLLGSCGVVAFVPRAAGYWARGMSQENVEIVTGALEEFIATGRLTDAVGADFTWDMSSFRGWPDQPTFHGFDGFSEFMNAWREPYEDWSMAIEQVLDAGGDEVLAVVVQRGRLRGSDSDVGLRYGLVYTVLDGHVRRARAYASPEEAFEAAGVRG